MTLLRYCPLVALVAGPLAAADPFLETTHVRQVIAALEKVTDEKSAAGVPPKLADLWKKHSDATKSFLVACERLPLAQQARLLEATGKDLAVLNKSLRGEHDRLFTNRKEAYAVLKGTDVFASIEAGIERDAADRAELLLKVVQSYSVRNGKAPTRLGEVAKMLTDGEKALLDPWGTPYRYERNADPKDARPNIWTVSPYSAKSLGHPPVAK